MFGVAGFLAAVSVVSVGIFVLTTRTENRSLRRARARGGANYDGGSSSGSDSWSFANWVGYSSSIDASNVADSSACTSGSWDSGSSDSGGGDCGGGGDGGGGGGD